MSRSGWVSIRADWPIAWLPQTMQRENAAVNPPSRMAHLPRDRRNGWEPAGRGPDLFSPP